MMGRWVYICQRELLVAHGKEGKDTALSTGNGEMPRLMPRGMEVCEYAGDVGLSLHIHTIFGEEVEISLW